MKNFFFRHLFTIGFAFLFIFFLISLYLMNTMYIIFYFVLLYPFLISFVVFFAANSIGHLLFSRAFQDNHTAIARECLFTALGLTFLIFFVIILGAFSLFKYLNCFIILIIISAFSYKRILTWCKELQIHSPINLKISEITLLVLIVVSALIHLINSLAPPIFYDALEYHLAVPEKFLQKGGFHFIQNNVYSNFPFNIEMLYLIGLQSGREIVPKLINFCFYLLNLLVIYSICHYLKTPRLISLIAVLLFSTFFITNSLTLYCYIELGITFFILLLFYTFLHWIDSRKIEDFLVLSVLSGVIIGCKYTTILIYFIPFLIILIIELLFIEKKMSVSIAKILLFIFVTITIFSPWIIKNLVLTGNPVYPLCYSLFGGRDWSVQQSTLFTVSHQPHNIFSPLFLKTIFSRLGLIGYLNIILILISFFIKDLKREIKLIGIYIILSFLFWNFFTQGDSRFFAINSPISIILGLYILYNLIMSYQTKMSFPRKWESRNKFDIILDSRVNGNDISDVLPKGFHLFTVLFILQALLGMANSFLLQDRHKIHSYFTGKIDEFEYKTINIEGYPALVKYLNESISPNTKCIFLYEARTFGVKQEVYYNTIFDQNYLIENLKRFANVDELKTQLTKDGIQYIILNESERDRFKERFYGVNYYRELLNKERVLLQELINSLKIEKIIINGDNPPIEGFRIMIYKID